MKWIGMSFVLVAACVSADYTAIGEQRYQERAKDWPIDVYADETAPVGVHRAAGGQVKGKDQIPGNAIKIGRVDLTGAELAGWGKMIETAQAKARTLGGDAIFVHGVGEQVSGTSANSYGQTSVNRQKGMWCTVYRYSK